MPAPAQEAPTGSSPTGDTPTAIAIIVLAAGAGTRFGGAKQVATVNGETLVARALNVALAAAAESDHICLITGAHAALVIAALETALPPDLLARVTILHNPAWESGQASSVRTAVTALAPSVGAALFLPVDQPRLQSNLLRQMMQAWRAGAPLVAAQVDGALRGAPALFDRRYFPELAALSGDTGGREIVRRYADTVLGIPVDAAQVIDVDTRQSLNDLT